MRTGPLPNHVDSLSRVAPAVRIFHPDAAALKFRQAAASPQSWPPATNAIRPPAPGDAECPELATGTVLHVHHSPV
jgi:hypothetical protein